MKTRFGFAIALGALCCLLVSSTTAQTVTGAKARGIFMKYDSGKTDGMRIFVLKADGSQLIPVDPSNSFKKGDEIKVAFESNFDGYVYIVNITPGGKKRILFPVKGGSNAVTPRQRYELPAGASSSFVFDEEKGTEILQVVMARSPITAYDDAIKNSNGEMGESASNAAAELASNTATPPKTGIVSENVAIPQSELGNVRSRKVVLAPGKDKDEKGSVVAIPDTKGQSGKLNTGEVAVFEIRLNHV